MKIQKITSGFVIQTFDTDAQSWVSQEFVAGDECDYEVVGDDGIPDIISTEQFMSHVKGENEPYLLYDMVQPDTDNDTEEQQRRDEKNGLYAEHEDIAN